MQENNSYYPFLHPLQKVTVGVDLPIIESGDGSYVRDTNGKKYLDANSGLWNISLGYNHPEINSAINAQLSELSYTNLANFSNPTTLNFAETLLSSLSDSFCKVAFTCTGSESVEFSIKLVRQYFRLLGETRKTKIVALDQSYHGTYYGSMSASGIDQEITKDYGPCVPGFHFVKTPFCHCSSESICKVCLEKRLHELEYLFSNEKDNIAGFLVEPVLGSAGVIPLHEEYLNKVKELCTSYNVLLIFDEVATGFGRTGYMYAFQEVGITPDILCLSKGINGGYLPLGAAVFNKKIFKVLDSNNCAIEHLSTQNGNPVSCAAGSATITILNREGFIEEIRRKGELLKSALQIALKNTPYFVEVRGKGLMLAIALSPERNKEKLLSVNEVMKITNLLFQKGLIVHPLYVPLWTSGIIIFPPLIITDSEIEKLVSILLKVLSRRI